MAGLHTAHHSDLNSPKYSSQGNSSVLTEIIGMQKNTNRATADNSDKVKKIKLGRAAGQAQQSSGSQVRSKEVKRT